MVLRSFSPGDEVSFSVRGLLHLGTVVRVGHRYAYVEATGGKVFKLLPSQLVRRP